MKDIQHKIVACEDDPDALERICNIILSLGHIPIPLTTLEEIKAFLESGEDPCCWIQDIQMPHKKNVEPHEGCGETSMRWMRARSNGKHAWPLIVLTGFRSDPEYVMNAARIGADEFITKKDIAKLADKILYWLQQKGREHHADCAACNLRSRPPKTEPAADADAAPAKGPVVARLYSHEQPVGARDITQDEVDDIIARRRQLHFFLNALTEEREGYRAGRMDIESRYKDVFLQRSQAEILVELVTTRAAVQPYTMTCLKRAGLGRSQTGAIRLVEVARKMVDVNPMVQGRVSRRSWRCIHTTGDGDLKSFWFDPGPGVRWAVMSASP